MSDRKTEIIYSEPVSAIMGYPPGNILKWGTIVIFVLFVLFILFAWFIKYPDIIPSPVEITTQNPPVRLVSKITGRIKHLYIRDKEKILKGDVLAVMETAASFKEVEMLRILVDTTKNAESISYELLPALSDLGELQVSYGSFLKSIADYSIYVRNDFYGNKINSAKDEIKRIQIYIERLKESERLYSENLFLEIRKFKRDSSLNANKLSPDIDYEKSRQALLRQKIELQQVRLDIASKNIEMAGKQQLLQEYSISRLEENQKLSAILNESFSNLKAQIKMWENNYLLISPVSGVVTFTKYWSENQSVDKDESVLSIIPTKQGDFIGRIYLKMQRSGKVKPGQMVNIKLSSYPYMEYGMVRGIIKTMSLVPSGDAYVIEIELPEGLSTLYGKKLEFTQNMLGTAEIITEDMRLLQKIVNPFRYLLSRNKR
jgi:multidrug resistance efflux pump